MDFTDLKVWQKARQLCVEVYRATERFPPRERFGLTDQIRRAALSACANIAESFGRGGGRDFSCHLRIARGSANEVRCCAIVATDLSFLGTTARAVLDALAVEVGKMLTALLKYTGGLV
jgi:four helix bundle protein